MLEQRRWDNGGMGLPSLLPCPGCGRHVRRDEDACPFCGREVGSLFLHPQLMRGSLGVGAICLLATACGGPEAANGEVEEYVDAGHIRFYFPPDKPVCAGTPTSTTC